ncbi:MAG: hypothetical protein V1721_10345 [Pseudomonadota bacterium]
MAIRIKKKTQNPLVSEDQINLWQREYVRVTGEIDDLKTKIKSLPALEERRKKLEQLIEIADSDSLALPSAKKKIRKYNLKKSVSEKNTITKRAGKDTWTYTILKIITEANHGLTYREVKEKIRKTSLAKRLESSEQGFYNAILRLADRDEKIVRHNGRLFTPEAYERFQKDVAAGLIKDEKPLHSGHPHRSPMGEAITEYLNKIYPRSVNSKELEKEMMKTPDFHQSLRHKTHLYNVLSRLIHERKEVEKEGKLYRAARKV